MTPVITDVKAATVALKWAVDEMERLLWKALTVLSPDQVWANPDCGLKTRGWAEVAPALENLVAAARRIRTEVAGAPVSTAAVG